MGNAESHPWLEIVQKFYALADEDAFRHGRPTAAVAQRAVPLTTERRGHAVMLEPDALTDVRVAMGTEQVATLHIEGLMGGRERVHLKTQLALALQIANAADATAATDDVFGTIRGLVIYACSEAFATPTPRELLPRVRLCRDLVDVDGRTHPRDSEFLCMRWDGDALLRYDGPSLILPTTPMRRHAEAMAAQPPGQLSIVGVCARGAPLAVRRRLRAQLPLSTIVVWLDIDSGMLGLHACACPRCDNGVGACVCADLLERLAVYASMQRILVPAGFTRTPCVLSRLLIGAGVPVELVVLGRAVDPVGRGAEADDVPDRVALTGDV